MFRVYRALVVFDRKHFNEIWIDPHYEEKHSDSITDDLILALVQKLGGKTAEPHAEANGFRYYEIEVSYQQRLYRLILVRPADDSYLGIRNTYRRSQ